MWIIYTSKCMGKVQPVSLCREADETMQHFILHCRELESTRASFISALCDSVVFEDN